MLKTFGILDIALTEMPSDKCKPTSVCREMLEPVRNKATATRQEKRSRTQRITKQRAGSTSSTSVHG